MPSESSTRPRPQRSDGEQSRERLLHAALTLFAAHGYATTSTREIAEVAGTNLAAISYYFGDKAGLYRAAFTEPMGCQHAADAVHSDGATRGLTETLHGLYGNFLTPLRQGDTARLCMKLQLREMLEPTGLWEHEITHNIKPMHDALVTLLCRHFGLAAADDDMERLAICITALGVHLNIAGDVLDVLAPALQAGDQAIELWIERLVMYAMAMVDAESARRRATPTARSNT